MRRFRIEKRKWGLKVRRHSKSDRAISTIMANLTMLIIVVFLSTLLFTWSIASFGAYQGGAGYWFSSRSLANQERPSVENVFFYQSGPGPSYFAKIYVRNVGTIEFTIDSVYVNSTRYNIAQQTVGVSQVALLVGVNGLLLNGPYGKGDLQKITLATLRGTTIATTWVA
ncbi:MAG TPA: hypothetical protein VIK88_01865 [Candidatus Bathyarchaeia archaeon]